MTDTVSGIIERVTFHNPENGFAVLKVKAKGQNRLVTVVGTTTMAIVGEALEASGQWVVDREHGRQFRAEKIVTDHPASVEGIERYLGSGAIRSVGPKLAERIVALYKERSLEIIDSYPDMLLHIRGVGPERLKKIRQSWREQKAVREILLFLHTYGIGSQRAVRIYRTYGAQAIALIRENPYRLADDIRGIGFKTADEMAARMGIDARSPHRARAAIMYTLQQLTHEGHCGFPQSGVVARTVALVEIEQALVEDAIEHQVQARAVVREVGEEEPWLFLTPLYQAEVSLAHSVHRLLAATTHPLPPVDLEKAIPWVEQKLELVLADAQRHAVAEACRQSLLVITGGPGVGKTTLVRSILEIFEAKGVRAVLAAPTGRAAKRLEETTGRGAKTLHRLLEFDPTTGDFKRNPTRPLSGQLFVLDETSMVDVVLGHQFLRAVPTGACVVLVGDVDQLPSVGPGMVLADLIASRVAPVVRLTQIFRQAEQSRIIAAAYAVNHGRLPRLETSRDELTDFYFAEANEPDQVQERIVRLVSERIPQRFGLDPRTDVQVLSPMNRSPLGARHLNEVLQEKLNPLHGQAEVERFGTKFRVADRVIQTENNYERDVFNGDLGFIESINRIDQELSVSFDGRSVTYDFDSLDELSLAYVLTIHKSQGSEYPCVVIPIHTQHYVMLQRNLLYTAITRGKRLVVLVGSRKALSLAVRREDTHRRYSALCRRLQSS